MSEFTADTIDYSVVIPAHNAARTLREAIESLLNQTLPPAAIIVVDDGSSDSTSDIAQEFGSAVTLLRQDRRGPGAATDRGFAAVTTPFVAGLDADDIWLAHKAARQLSLLTADPNLDGIFCQAFLFAHGSIRDPGGPRQDLWGHSGMMLRSATLKKIGVVSSGEKAACGEMIRWLAEGRRIGLRFRMVPEIMVGRRIIEGSLSYGRDPWALLPMIRERLRSRIKT